MVVDLATVAIPTCIIVVILFGAWALYVGRLNALVSKPDLDFYLTARNSQSASTIAWSFFSASVGAWVIFVPSAFCVDEEYGAGWLGLLSYSFFMGLPILLIALTGSVIRKRYPSVLSVGDFVRLRYGRPVEIYVAILVFVNTAIALAAEYTAIGDLFQNVLGSSRLMPVILIGVVTLVYTSVGGLAASLVTDKYQAILALILLSITCIYVMIEFRPGELPDLPPNLALNYWGISSLATLGIALPSAAFFSDAFWQRVWSSENNRALTIGAIGGSVLTSLVIFAFGFFGFLAAWAGYVKDPSTAFFEILRGGKESEQPVWILVLVCIIATTLSESAIDSFQTAITGTTVALAISMGFKATIRDTRIAAFVLNIPLIFVGFQGFKIVSLYLVMNILTTTATMPIIIGLLPQMESYVSGAAVLFGGALSITSVIIYGYLSTGSLTEGIYKYFYEVYAWEPFVIAVSFSIIGVLGFAALEILIYLYIGKPYVPDVSLPKRIDSFETIPLDDYVDASDVPLKRDPDISAPSSLLTLQ